MDSDVRIDKYLWCVRMFKTRSEASEACKSGKVKVGPAAAKPSRDVRVGEVISVRKGAVTLTIRVLDVPSGRVGASLVENYAEDLTPPEERARLEAPRENIFLHRERGTGRPTKKERRTLDRLMDSLE